MVKFILFTVPLVVIALWKPLLAGIERPGSPVVAGYAGVSMPDAWPSLKESTSRGFGSNVRDPWATIKPSPASARRAVSAEQSVILGVVLVAWWSMAAIWTGRSWLGVAR